jgi:ABC-type sugar transport system ATPase subunit
VSLPLLEMDAIRMAFDQTVAVDGVSISVPAGEVRAVVGENGAGKSTLVKVLAGVYPAGSYSGAIRLNGQEQRFHNVADAERLGVLMVPQELNLVEEQSVAENVLLNRLPGRGGLVDYRALYTQADQHLKALQIDVNPTVRVKHLGVAQKQMVAIARALAYNVKVLILDEPTATLSDSESDILFDRVARLKAAGVACLYISHRLEEVLEIADNVTVLRDGELVGTAPAKELTEQQVASMMIGRDLEHFFVHHDRTAGDVALSVKALTLWDPQVPERKVVDDVSFDIRAGEIVGMYGLVGAGRTEMALGLVGAWPGQARGEVWMRGKSLADRTPASALSAGMVYLPEDRKRQAVIPDLSVNSNISAASIDQVSHLGLIQKRDELARNQGYVSDFSIKTRDLWAAIRSLSGGNQQKTILARLVATGARVLLLDEPTQGIDVGAKAEVYAILNRLADGGQAVLFISSDLPELIGVADRILVMREGRLAGSYVPRETTREHIFERATLDLERSLVN